MNPSTQNTQQQLIQKIAKWKAGLADLGRRNPLIKLRQDSPRTLEILTDELDILFENLAEEKKTLNFQMLDSEYQDIALLKKTKALPPPKNPLELITRQTGNEQLNRLKKLRSEARKSIEERGVNSLFLALGTLTWYDKDKPEEALASPLILIPVELIKEPRRDIYQILALEEDIVLNPTLAQKLKQTFGIEFPDLEVIEEPTYHKIIDQIRKLLAGKNTWQIQDNVFLSLFSYAKAAMVRDIIENENLIFSHPILQAISGDLTNYQSNYSEPLPASALDLQVKPERIFQVLDADSSQQVVIEAAKAGSSFVVEGPPGTGKSQTIVNMIAELAGAGKSVLLVAEKETALSVVYKRMAECGLDHICLNLHHGGTTDKKELVNNLSRTIDYLLQISGADNNHPFFERLISTRQSITSYLTSLHTKEKPLDKSPFEIYGEILRKERERVPNINVIFSNFHQWTPSRLIEAKDLLSQLAHFLPFFKGEKTTIWAKSSLRSYSFEIELEIKERLGEFQQVIVSTQDINQQLQLMLKVEAFSNFESLENSYPALAYISESPSQLPEKFTTLDVSIAENALSILKIDVHEIEKNSLSPEIQSLLVKMNKFLPFLREEKSNIWRSSNLKNCNSDLELDIKENLDRLQKAIVSSQNISQRIQELIQFHPLSNLEFLENCYAALSYLANAPSNLPENWVLLDIASINISLDILKTDVQEIEKNTLPKETSDLLKRLSSFLPFLRGQTTTIWAKSQIKSLSESLQLEINNKIDRFHQSISRLQAISQQMQMIVGIKPLLNLGDIEACLPALNHVFNAPADLPDDWTEVDIVTAQNAFTKLKSDVKFLEENEQYIKEKYHADLFSSELPTLANRFQRYSRFWIIRVFNPRYRNDIKLLKKLRTQERKFSFNELKRDLTQAVKVQATRNELYHNNYTGSQIFGSLFNPEFSHETELRQIEQALSWLNRLQQYSLPATSVQNIVNSPSIRQELGELIKKIESFPEQFKEGMDFLLLYFDENDIIGRYLPHNQILLIDIINFLELAKTELVTFAKWLTYKEIHEQLEGLDVPEFVDALREDKPNPIVVLRNQLSHIDYPPTQVFGSLFNPQISRTTELKSIEEAFNWLLGLQRYSLPSDSVQRIINSPSLRRELAEIVKKLQLINDNIRQGLEFMWSYFDESNITVSYLPRNQISFPQIQEFLNVAQSDLPYLQDWLIYEEIYKKLEVSGAKKFLDALRDDKPNPIELLRNKLQQIDYLPAQIFGSLFNPQISIAAELKPVEEALKWLIGLQKYSLPANSVQIIINSPLLRRELAQIVNKFELSRNNIRKGLDFILSYFDESDITDSNLSRNQIPFIELENFLNLAQEQLLYFQEWLTYKDTYEKLENLGVKKFLDTLYESKIETKLWFPVLEKLIYQTCLEAILSRKTELKNFNVEVHEQQIKEFSQLDNYQLFAARERLKQVHVKRWQNHENTSTIRFELPRLKREVNRQKQHLPIRKLLNDRDKGIPNLVKALKPCWMMSPLSVSQYINADEVHFDVLIFDEASQLLTEDVVPSIIRANQVIVMGDKQQLPPTSFFVTGEGGEGEENSNNEEDIKLESVLNECSIFMFGRTLKWHYRSRDERLIAFSNKHFYDSQLVTFPNPVQNPDLGVWFKHVSDGVYDRGGRADNRKEAQVVALLALEHFQRVPDQSLGIIAFSEGQADAIQEQIEILGKDNTSFDIFCSDNSPRFFLKALENVQGDERDAIILSVGYGRDSQGKLNLNFGPINKQGGERRLNVAVTRAKSKITLVSSIVAGDIDLSSSKSKGLRCLRDYLEYAVSGGERLEGNFYTDQLNFDSPFEEDVYHTLAEQGYTIRSQVGCSGYRIDLAVVNQNRPGEFLLGIECDGASYHSSPTARDRDRLRQKVLENLGWKIHRIWSTDWFRNKPAQTRLLVEKIEQLQRT